MSLGMGRLAIAVGCQTQVLIQQLNGGGPMRGRQVGRCPPKSAQFWAKKRFSPKIAPKPGQNTPTMAKCHLQLDFNVSKSPLVPFKSMICPRNGPKRRQKARKSAQCAPTPRNQARAVSWAAWLKIRFRGHLFHLHPPNFCGSQTSESPNETRRPPNMWSVCGAGGQPGPHTAGANGGSTGVPGAKKITFSKVVPGPLGMLKQAFIAHFEPVVTRFGPWKISKYLDNGPFLDQKCVKNGSKMRFSKSDPGPFGMLKQVILAHFELVVTCFGPWKLPKCLENGPLWDQKWVKNGP